MTEGEKEVRQPKERMVTLGVTKDPFHFSFRNFICTKVSLVGIFSTKNKIINFFLERRAKMSLR